MAILGYSTQGGSGFSPDAGRKMASKFTLASALTLTELHAWVRHPVTAGGYTQSYVIHIHADSSGLPGARLAYTSVIGPLSGAGSPVEISQSGFSTALAAGDYWLGLTFQDYADGGGAVYYDSGATLRAALSGATFNPPSDPFGTASYTTDAKLSVWAVVGTPATPPVAAFSGTPLSGTPPLEVAFSDASTNSPTSWAWDFGDGDTDTVQNPTHEYADIGTYDVELVATNAGGSDTETKTGYVTVSPRVGSFSRIKLGPGLVGTDLGSGVIEIDVA